jgi:hypothetical protein
MARGMECRGAESSVGWHRPYNGPCIDPAARRFDNEKFLSVGTGGDLRVQRCKGRIGTRLCTQLLVAQISER